MAPALRDAGTDDERMEEKRREWLGATLRSFPWVHLALGLLGNTAFFVGSIFFFYEHLKTAGIWLFVVGSLGMLVGSIGQLLVSVERKRCGDD